MFRALGVDMLAGTRQFVRIHSAKLHDRKGFPRPGVYIRAHDQVAETFQRCRAQDPLLVLLLTLLNMTI
jgi:hypothetical protein